MWGFEVNVHLFAQFSRHQSGTVAEVLGLSPASVASYWNSSVGTDGSQELGDTQETADRHTEWKVIAGSSLAFHWVRGKRP